MEIKLFPFILFLLANLILIIGAENLTKLKFVQNKSNKAREVHQSIDVISVSANCIKGDGTEFDPCELRNSENASISLDVLTPEFPKDYNVKHYLLDVVATAKVFFIPVTKEILKNGEFKEPNGNECFKGTTRYTLKKEFPLGKPAHDLNIIFKSETRIKDSNQNEVHSFYSYGKIIP